MKRILLVATGGTIASAEDGHGLSPALTGDELARSVPELGRLCALDIVQPMNIDSTNMRPTDWLRIEQAILDGYDTHDGFVILHGTDTMAYTAAALSYLIQASPKPIALTGSQQPMGHPFTDAKLNLYQSLLWATDDHARDVAIVFNGKVIAGTRGRKQRTMSFNAFTSVNYPSLAYIRRDRVIRGAVGSDTSAPALASVAQASSPFPHDAPGSAAADSAPHPDGPRIYHTIDDRVCTLKLTPGLTPGIFDLLKPDYDALILETFGIGGIPDVAFRGGSPARTGSFTTFEEAIFDWVDSGRAIVMTTQVPEEGLDLGVYEVGRAYAEHPGILKGGDMTTEALVAKTMWALGQTKDPEALAALFYRPVNHDRLPDA